MMNKCSGCGVILQNEKIDELGYTTNLNSKFCERCFRIKNYGDYKQVIKDKTSLVKILEQIPNNALTVIVTDILNIDKDFSTYENILKGPILFVLTKRDIMPKFYEQRILDYINSSKLNIIDKLIISSKNNYHLDELYSIINNYHKVYFVGYTNAGKSTLINKLLYNYGNEISRITTSILPNTTLETIEIKLGNTLLIDSPGLINEGSIINYVDSKLLKKIVANDKIKPITYQIKSPQIININDIFELYIDNNDITIYISNKLSITRIYDITKRNNNLIEQEIEVNAKEDLVICGLGFIKIKNKTKIKVATLDGILVYTRKSLF